MALDSLPGSWWRGLNRRKGYRPFTEAPANWPHLAAFHRRIAAILDQPAPIDEDGALTPPMLTLTPEAKAAWVEYHDAIESELASGGELYDVRDVASKSADNAARLAALFQIFEHGMGGAIGLDCFRGGKPNRGMAPERIPALLWRACPTGGTGGRGAAG